MLIEVLFGEVCNLCGDGQNEVYLREMLPEAEFVDTALNDEPAFVTRRPDMVLLGSMTEAIQRRVIDKLMPYKKRIEELTEDGVVFLATGNACEVFTKHIDYVTEEISKDGLGIFDLTVKNNLFDRYNGKFLGEVAGIPVVGFRSQFSRIYGDNSTGFFAENQRAMGINPDTHLEGMRRKNFIGTQILGPILPLNPLFTEYLVSLTGVKAEAPFRKASMAAYEQRLKEFQDPETKF